MEAGDDSAVALWDLWEMLQPRTPDADGASRDKRAGEYGVYIWIYTLGLPVAVS